MMSNDAPINESRMLVVIPAWNEAEVIGGVLSELAYALGETADLLVVSDGSTDETAHVAREAGACVIELPINLGVGGAMRTGFLYALRNGYERVLQVDADGQHDPSEIPALLACAAQTGADIVIGARFAGRGKYAVRGPRKWAMSLLSLVLSRVCRTPLTDTTSGFKLMSRRALEVFAYDYPAEYLGDTIEALVIASRSGLRVRQVPVAMRPRAGGEPSHNPVKAARFLLRAVVALVVALTRPRQTSAGGGL